VSSGPTLPATLSTASGAASPSVGPSPSSSPLTALRGDVVVNGRLLGTVSVASVHHPARVGGMAAEPGTHWLVVRVRYEARDQMPYDARDWAIADAAGVSYPWAGVDPDPSLGRGRLQAGDHRVGNVTFRAPLNAMLTLVFSGGDSLQFLEVVQLLGSR
jgi:hypothetical protein